VLPGVDVLVLPSLMDGTAANLPEATAEGIPVMASAVGEIPAILRRDQKWVLVDPSG
jgi:glycosyltransferase involved in cell wall biosynthesis